MKLSITSNAVYGVRTDGKVQFMPELGIAQCAQAGFQYMEYNFLNGPANDKILAADHWRDRVAGLRKTMDEHRIAAPYTHDYWYLLSAARRDGPPQRGSIVCSGQQNDGGTYPVHI